jgi:hypothetical protein
MTRQIRQGKAMLSRFVPVRTVYDSLSQVRAGLAMIGYVRQVRPG